MTVSTLSMWSCLLFNLKNGLFLSNLFTVLSLYHLYLPVIIMITFLSFLRERDFRPDTSTWTLDPPFSAFSRIWLIHSFWYLQFIFPRGLESSSSHTHWKVWMCICWVSEWISRSSLAPGSPQASAPSDFPVIAILERVVYTCCVSIPNSHLLLNFCILTYYYAVEFPLVVINYLPNIYSLSKLLDSTWYPATFDTADHSGWRVRESLFVWLFYHSILILLSVSNPFSFLSNFSYCSIPIF